MLCLVGLQKKLLRLHAFELHLLNLIFTLLNFIFLSFTFPQLVFTPLSITLLNLAPLSHFSDLAFSDLILSALYIFSIPSDPYLQNTCLVLATLVVRRVTKQASQQTYKDNVCRMKLSCKSIEKR